MLTRVKHRHHDVVLPEDGDRSMLGGGTVSAHATELSDSYCQHAISPPQLLEIGVGSRASSSSRLTIRRQGSVCRFLRASTLISSGKLSR